MKTRAVLTLGLVALIVVAACINCAAYDPNWKKSQCDAYSYHGLHERYVFGGDKGWIDNDVWDSPSVEGVDCSDYVPRCLALPNYVGEHTPSGHPYSTASMYPGIANTVRLGSINDMQQWDFFVWRTGDGGHTGLFKQYSGSNIITREARGTAYGIVEVTRSKQSLIDLGSRYYRRANWGAEADYNMYCWAKGDDGVVRARRWSKSGGWTDTWNSITQPSCGTHADSGVGACAQADNMTDVFVLGSDGLVYKRSRAANGTWGSWASIGSNGTYTLVGTPDAASWAKNRIDVVIRSSNNECLRKRSTDGGSTWSSWINEGGNITSNPGIACWAPNRIDIFARGSGGTLVHRWWNGSTWLGWEDLGGTLVGGPAVASSAEGCLDVFYRGTDNAIKRKYFRSGSGWSGVSSLGGAFYTDPGATSYMSGHLAVFAEALYGAVHKIEYSSGSGWGSWSALGDTGTTTKPLAGSSWSNVSGTR